MEPSAFPLVGGAVAGAAVVAGVLWQYGAFARSEEHRAPSDNKEAEREPEVSAETLFLRACKEGNVAEVGRLVQQDIDHMAVTLDGCNALHLLAISGNEEALHAVLGYTASFGREDILRVALQGRTKSEGWQPLHIVGALGQSKFVNAFIRYGGDYRALDATERTPLLISACNGHVGTVEALLACGYDMALLGARSKGDRKSALFYAVMNGHEEVVRLLLQARATCIERGETDLELDPLHAKDGGGNSIMHAAAMSGSVTIASMLIEAGATVSGASDAGQTPLTVCCIRRDEVERADVAELLLRSGCNTTTISAFGSTALHEACLFANVQFVKLILEHEERLGLPMAERSIRSQDFDGMYPIHCACSAAARSDAPVEDLLQTMGMLLQHGADANMLDYSDSTPLHHLCCSPSSEAVLELISLVLDNGGDPLLEDITGWNAVHSAHSGLRNGKEFAQQTIELVTNWLRENRPGALSDFEPDKKRGSNDLFHHRKGPHNRIPLETRQAVLDGDFTIAGIGAYLRARMAESEASGSPLPKVVVLTGAGISVNCGIPDFRSPGTGMYAKQDTKRLFDRVTFMEHPDDFYHMVKKVFLPVASGQCQPSLTHHFIAMLHEKGLLLRNYTQNIDMLEEMAGIPPEKIVASHGSFQTAHCTKASCGAAADMKKLWRDVASGRVPLCKSCKGLVKPDVVFFGDGMPGRFLDLGKEDLCQADLLIVMGTTLVVYPFAGMVGKVPLLTPRLLINREAVGPFRGLDPKFNYRDVCHLGDCDEGVRELATLLGWEGQLVQRKETHRCEPILRR